MAADLHLMATRPHRDADRRAAGQEAVDEYPEPGRLHFDAQDSGLLDLDHPGGGIDGDRIDPALGVREPLARQIETIAVAGIDDVLAGQEAQLAQRQWLVSGWPGQRAR